MKNSIVKILGLVCFFSMTLLLQNCSPTNFSATPVYNSKVEPGAGPGTSTNTPVDPSIGTPLNQGDTNNPPGFGNLTPNDVIKFCPHFRPKSDSPIITDSLLLSGLGIKIISSVNNLSIQNFAGIVLAKANTITEVTDFAGIALLEAQKVGDITNYAGIGACLSTGQLGNINNAAGIFNIFGPKDSSGQGGNITYAAGLMYLANMNWQTIENVVGGIEINRGSVQLLSNISGNITLDGVQVDTLDGLNKGAIVHLRNGSAIKTIKNMNGQLLPN